MSTALVVIDVQQGMFTAKHSLHRGDEVVARIADLLMRARHAGIPVFHVQHDGGPGHILEKGSAGWAHHPKAMPLVGESVVEKRTYSAFQATDLDARLKLARVHKLVVCGVQTEVCVDTACRAASALGYEVTLVSDAHTTFESAVLPADMIVRHHNETLRNRFAKLALADEVEF